MLHLHIPALDLFQKFRKCHLVVGAGRLQGHNTAQQHGCNGAGLPPHLATCSPVKRYCPCGKAVSLLSMEELCSCSAPDLSHEVHSDQSCNQPDHRPCKVRQGAMRATPVRACVPSHDFNLLLCRRAEGRIIHRGIWGRADFLDKVTGQTGRPPGAQLPSEAEALGPLECFPSSVACCFFSALRGLSWH